MVRHRLFFTVLVPEPCSMYQGEMCRRSPPYRMVEEGHSLFLTRTDEALKSNPENT